MTLKFQLDDNTRLAILAFAQSVFPMLLIFGIDLSTEEIGAVMLFLNTGILLVARVFPKGQGVASAWPVRPRRTGVN